MVVVSLDNFMEYIDKEAPECPGGSVWEKIRWFFCSIPVINLLISVVLALVMLIITAILLQVCEIRRPDTPRLPDVVHEVVPYYNVISMLDLSIGLGIAAMAVLWVWPLRMRTIQILRRLAITYSLTMLLRDLFMPVTNLPDPTERCLKNYNAKMKYNPIDLLMTLVGGVTCGDMIYSGHVVGFLMPVLVTFHFYNTRLSWLLLLNALYGSVFTVISRLHYTVDVFISWAIYPMIFFIYNTVSEHPEVYADNLPYLLRYYFSKLEWRDPILWDDPTINSKSGGRDLVAAVNTEEMNELDPEIVLP